MIVNVTPIREGPDYAPAVSVCLQVDQVGDIPLGTALTLDVDTAADLWHKLGEALKVIEENADPS